MNSIEKLKASWLQESKVERLKTQYEGRGFYVLPGIVMGNGRGYIYGKKEKAYFPQSGNVFSPCPGYIAYKK